MLTVCWYAPPFGVIELRLAQLRWFEDSFWVDYGAGAALTCGDKGLLQVGAVPLRPFWNVHHMYCSQAWMQLCARR